MIRSPADRAAGSFAGRLVLVCLLLSVPAFGTTGVHQVVFRTRPPEARVYLLVSGKEGGEYLGLAGHPVALNLSRFDRVPGFDVRFELHGYRSAVRNIKSHYFDSHSAFPAVGAVVLQPTSRPIPWLGLAGVALVVAGAVGLTRKMRRPLGGPSPPSGDPLLGSKLGAYRLGGVLGTGGSGTVYRATGPGGDGVAVKVLMIEREPGAEQAVRRNFQREVKASMGLQHPGVVQLLDWGEQGQILYTVTELMAGGTLRERIPAAGMPVEQARDILRGLLEALSYAHAHGIIHRDLKPENVLFDARGRPHLGDFGLVRFEGHSSLSTNQGPVGTLVYASPEQIAGESPDALSDQYSLGIMIYELLAGRPPFGPEGGAALVFRHLSAPPPPLRGARPDLSAELEGVVNRMLSKEKMDRYASLEAAAAALEHAWS